MRSGRCMNQRSEVRSQKSDLRPLISDLSVSQFCRRDSFDYVALDLVADFDIVKVLQTDTTLEAFANFGSVFLKATQRGDVTFPTHDAVADQARARVALHDSVDDHATGDHAHPWHSEGFADVGLAENLFFFDLLEHADHRGLNLFFDLVDNRVQADVHVLLFRKVAGARFRPHIEADNYHRARRSAGLGRRCQQHVRLGDRAHAGADDFNFHALARHLLQSRFEDLD